MQTYKIENRSLIEINTDPQRRCYNGCHFSSEIVWTAWGTLRLSVPEDRVERTLAFWRNLNDYAVSQRGQMATTEYRAVPNDEVL